MDDLSDRAKCCDTIRMNKEVFLKLCKILISEGGLRPNQRMFFPYFKDCVGAIDGTHVRVRVPGKDVPRYHCRKGYPTINVLVACTFNLKFSYLLSDWEGTASYSRIIKDALSRDDKLFIPRGKYYLVDAGLPHRNGLIGPYRDKDRNLVAEEEVTKELEKEDPEMGQKIKDEDAIKRKQLIWTPIMDGLFIQSMLNQQYEGPRIDGTFTSEAYVNMVVKMRQKIGAISSINCISLTTTTKLSLSATSYSTLILLKR
ncbi:hypothetical protein POM88_018650 [Heracleum sosnowskyi]|uniref:DDE Tnp4 domain-containing protein n=1 Tax=Heracleum sosnowskyi TaxID=360622 RepID=A0AAD8IQY3_9APIA|nr:hypothetical protein POM88_018650 [Heracleum sosnowskyi]